MYSELKELATRDTAAALALLEDAYMLATEEYDKFFFSNLAADTYNKIGLDSVEDFKQIYADFDEIIEEIEEICSTLYSADELPFKLANAERYTQAADELHDRYKALCALYTAVERAEKAYKALTEEFEFIEDLSYSKSWSEDIELYI